MRTLTEQFLSIRQRSFMRSFRKMMLLPVYKLMKSMAGFSLLLMESAALLEQ